MSCVWLFLDHAKPFLSRIQEFMDSQLYVASGCPRVFRFGRDSMCCFVHAYSEVCVHIEHTHDLLKDNIYPEKYRVPQLPQPEPSQEACVGCGCRELDPGSCFQCRCQIPSQRWRLSFFSVIMIKYPDQSNLKKRGIFFPSSPSW